MVSVKNCVRISLLDMGDYAAIAILHQVATVIIVVSEVCSSVVERYQKWILNNFEKELQGAQIGLLKLFLADIIICFILCHSTP